MPVSQSSVHTRAAAPSRWRIVAALLTLLALQQTGSTHDHQKLEPGDGFKMPGIGNNTIHTANYVNALIAAQAPFRPLIEKRYMTPPKPTALTPQQSSNLVEWMAQARAAGRIPELRLGLNDPNAPVGQRGFDTAVAAGLHDAYFDSVAAVVKAYGGPIYIRIGSEFNEPATEESHPYDFPKAYQRIVDHFRNRAVDQAAWVWCILISGVVFTDWDAQDAAGNWLWYPGDEYVDWLGFDNFHPSAYFDPPTNTYGLHTNKFMAVRRRTPQTGHARRDVDVQDVRHRRSARRHE